MNSENPEMIFISDMPEYAKSRRLFLVDGIFAMIISVIVGGAYLSGCLNVIGMPDWLIGAMNAFPVMCGLAQIFGAFLAPKIGNDKRFVTIGAAAFRYGFALMYILTPVLRGYMGILIAAFLFFISCFFAALIIPSANTWILSLCPPAARGKYMGLRESLAMLCTAVAAVAAGNLLDFWERVNNPDMGFVIIGIFVAVCNTVNTVALTKIKKAPEDGNQKQEKGQSFLHLLKMPFMYKIFRPVIMLTSFYQIAVQMGVAYWSLFIIRDLGISFSFISTMTFFCMLLRGLLAHLWGRVADKTSWHFVTSIMLLFVGTAHIVYMFLTKENSSWLYIIAALISASGWSAMGICMLNIQYQYAPRVNTQMFVGTNNALSGVMGFLAVIAAGFIASAIGTDGLTIAEKTFAPYSILIGISGFMLLLTAGYIYLVLGRKKIIHPEDAARQAV